MTRDDIIRMALKCGASIKSDCVGNGAFCDGMDLIAFAALVAASEREECAEIADQHRNNMQFLASNPPQSAAAYDIAKAIRARGQE